MATATLVLGYGNTLRRDDGAGVEVARQLAALALADVEIVEAHQLLPEHAELLARADRAIFADASVDADLPGVALEQLDPPDPGAEIRLDPHLSDPGGLLALAAHLFGRAPEAWIVRLPVAELGIGEGLSPATSTAVNEAVRLIRDFCQPDPDRAGLPAGPRQGEP